MLRFYWSSLIWFCVSLLLNERYSIFVQALYCTLLGKSNMIDGQIDQWDCECSIFSKNQSKPKFFNSGCDDILVIPPPVTHVLHYSSVLFLRTQSFICLQDSLSFWFSFCQRRVCNVPFTANGRAQGYLSEAAEAAFGRRSPRSPCCRLLEPLSGHGHRAARR